MSPLFRKHAAATRQAGDQRTIFFASDLHGSEVCWRKFLNAAKFYNADVLICGGDMTGKAMIPLVEDGDAYELTLSGVHQRVSRDCGKRFAQLQRDRGRGGGGGNGLRDLGHDRVEVAGPPTQLG